MIITFKHRLFPNVSQLRELAETLETHRRLYNAALDGKQLCWEIGEVDWSLYEQQRWFTVQRKINPHYARLNVASAAQTFRQLDRSFAAFFRRVQAGGKPGYPRFKSRDKFNSFSFKCPRLWSDGCRIVGGRLRLQHIGTIRVRWHRPLPDGGSLREVRILREGDRWFAFFVLEITTPAPAARDGSVGVDVGLKTFLTTSEGEQLGDSRTLESRLNELRVKQRALSRCKRGSNSRQIVKKRVVDLHAKVRNTRRDMHHKVSRSLVSRYGVIAVERLNVQGLLKNHRLARRISDAGWYSFVIILASKAESAGGQVIQVDAKNTSQECSGCGAIVPKKLSERTHRCDCGLTLDRDHNAARNILARAAPGGLNPGVALDVPKSLQRKLRE